MTGGLVLGAGTGCRFRRVALVVASGDAFVQRTVVVVGAAVGVVCTVSFWVGDEEVILGEMGKNLIRIRMAVAQGSISSEPPPRLAPACGPQHHRHPSYASCGA